jgi:hypothetical protein
MRTEFRSGVYAVAVAGSSVPPPDVTKGEASERQTSPECAGKQRGESCGHGKVCDPDDGL